MSTLPAGEQPPVGEQGSQQGTTAAPPTTAPAATAESPLSRDTPIVMTDKEGKTISPTVGEMADAFRSQPSTEDLKELGLYRKAVKGNDPAAASELFGMYAPDKTPAPESTPADKRVEELEAKVAKMDAVISGELSPVVGQISTEAKLHQNRLLIEQKKDKFPFLAKAASSGPGLVENRKKAYEELAKSRNYDLKTAPADVLVKITERAMQDVENDLKALYGEISGTTPAVPGQGIVSVNDQGSPKKEVTSALPRYRQNRDGVYIDESRAAGSPGAAEPLSAVPVTPVPVGSPVGVQGDTKPEGPMDVTGLTERMRQRNQQLGGVL